MGAAGGTPTASKISPLARSTAVRRKVSANPKENTFPLKMLVSETERCCVFPFEFEFVCRCSRSLFGPSGQGEVLGFDRSFLLQRGHQDMRGVYVHRLRREQQQLCVVAKLHGRVR